MFKPSLAVSSLGRRSLHAASSALIAASCLFGCEAAAQQPNIIYILADDMGISDLGAYGGDISTPNLDTLAAEGAQFRRFYVQPRCSPTRAALLTGHQNHAVGFNVLSHDNNQLTPNHVMLPELLRANGYDTYMSGKWHLGGTNNFGSNGTIPGDDRTDPRVRGFDQVYTFDNSSHSEHTWNPNNYRLLTDGSIATRSYATSPGSTFYNRDPDNPDNSTFHQTDAITDYAIDFIRDNQARNTLNAADKPFFLYVAYGAPHFPLEAPKPIVDQYVATYSAGWDNIRADRFQSMVNLGIIPPDVLLTPRSEVQVFGGENPTLHWLPAWGTISAPRRADLVRRMAVYAAMIDQIDRNIGLILQELEDNGELNNTIIMFSTDNGACAEWHENGKSANDFLYSGTDLQEMGTNADGRVIHYGTGWANAGATPYRNYKHYTHEGGIRSPLIVSWPGHLHPSLSGGVDDSNGGAVLIDQVLHITDIMPTLLDLAGVAMPDQWTAQNGNTYDVKELDPNSVSFKDLLLSGTPIGDREFGIEHEGNRMYRVGDWKIVSSNYDSLDGTVADQWELYHLADDPTEINDLAGDPEQIGRLTQMIGKYNQWAFRNDVINSLPPSPPAPPAPRAGDLLLDSFERVNDTDADASATGMSGLLVPPLGAGSTYYEGFEGSGSVASIQVSDTMLQMATGAGMSESGLMHNFTDQAILDAGGFSVGLDVVQIDSTPGSDTANRFGGFAVGLSQSEAAAGGDVNEHPNTSFRLGVADFFVELDLDGNVKVRSGGTPLASVGVGATSGRIEAYFYVSGFGDGQTVDVAVFFNGTQLDINPANAARMTRSFAWDGAGANYLGLSARASSRVLLDNLRIATLLRGDTDGDGDIDNTDLQTAIANFTGPAGTGRGVAGGDTDGDGDIDNADLQNAIAGFTGPNP